MLGEYVLTEEDAMSGRRFQDAVAWRSGMLDIGFVRYEPMAVHDVPYGALLPNGWTICWWPGAASRPAT